MPNLNTVEIKAFVPSKDFDLSRRFYTDVGFTELWCSDDMAYMRSGASSFMLQKYYVKEFAESLMMHMLVEDVDAWWQQLEERKVASKYGLRADPPENRPWGIRDFILVDPCGVLWRIGQEIDAQ